jgi:hypothetical protein
MHLKRLRVANFRALEKIDVNFDTRVSVIIGPNAIGKTTVLEAVRMAKGILAPRTQNETNQILFAIGAMSPHLPGRLFPAALTTKPSNPLTIKCTYELAEDEIHKLRSMAPQLASIAAQQGAGIRMARPSQVLSFLNSPMGQTAVNQARSSIDSQLKQLDSTPTIELNLTIDFRTGQIAGEFPLQQICLQPWSSLCHQPRASFRTSLRTERFPLVSNLYSWE